MIYSCSCVPCLQKMSRRSRDDATTDAVGGFCFTCTFSKRAHLIVKLVREDQLWASEPGKVHLLLYFAVLPSEAKRKLFSIEMNLQLCCLTLSRDLLRTFHRGAGKVWKTNQKPHLGKVLCFCWHHRSPCFGQGRTKFLSNLTAELWSDEQTVKLMQSCFHYCYHMCTMSMEAAAPVGSVSEGRHKS